MAKEEKKKSAAPAPTKPVAPTFVIRADQPGAIQGLVAAQAAMGIQDEALVREFELYVKRERGCA